MKNNRNHDPELKSTLCTALAQADIVEILDDEHLADHLLNALNRNGYIIIKAMTCCKSCGDVLTDAIARYRSCCHECWEDISNEGRK